MKNGSEIQGWNLDGIYSSFTSKEYLKDKEEYGTMQKDFASELERFSESPVPGLEVSFVKLVNYYNRSNDLYEQLYSFAYAKYSVNTFDSSAVNELNSLDGIHIPASLNSFKFQRLIKKHLSAIRLMKERPVFKEYTFFIEEAVLLAEKQMSESEESLAGELSVPGGLAWSRMQSTITSALKVLWDENTGETKSLVELREQAHSKDRNIREKAFTLELLLLESVKVPLAFALNGVKGFACVLDRKRQYADPLEKALIQSRLTPKALDALINTLKGSRSLFNKYFTHKAELLGLEKLAFYDIFSPVGYEGIKKYTVKEAEAAVTECFSSFSPAFSSFAKTIYDSRYVDYTPRDGKVGGAYCTSFPLAKQSRILCNFTGTFSNILTLAHETGHAWHYELLKTVPAANRNYPMILAETASIFAENIVYDAALNELKGQERLSVLESFLQDCAQVIIDILSRFIFEKKVFEIRKNRELAPEEFCILMTEAQKEAYTDALDENLLHPYMWAVKGHYYNQDLGFYNYPYAFGLLFGLAMYSLYKQEGSSFEAKYVEVLKNSGQKSANDITKSLGFDIESDGFWALALSVIEDRINDFIQE
jgi:pepF/M3 family oligoendopeptidase